MLHKHTDAPVGFMTAAADDPSVHPLSPAVCRVKQVVLAQGTTRAALLGLAQAQALATIKALTLEQAKAHM